MNHDQTQVSDARLRLEDAIAQSSGLADTLMQLDLEKADRISTPSFHRTAWALSSLLHQAGDDLETVLTAGAPSAASGEPDWPERSEQSTGQPFDRERYRRGMSVLQVLLAKMDSDDSSGLQACDTLESAIKELQAAGGLEQ